MLRLTSAVLACAVVLSSVPGALAKHKPGADNEPVANVATKIWPAVIALCLYLISGGIHWIHLRRMGRRFMLVLPVAMYCMAFGFIMRLVFSENNTSLGLYIIMNLFILLSPCAFLATDYVLLQNLSEAMGEDIAEKCLFLNSKLVVKLFVISDVVTFLIQACGGGMMAIMNVKTQELGSNIAIAGLSLQLASFAMFTALLLFFGYNVKTKYPQAWYIASPNEFPSLKGFSLWSKEPLRDWRLLYFVMCLTCVGIITRCSFRIAEFKEGYNGYLQLHEGYFYLLDSLPLWIAMTLYCFLWPPRLIARDGIVRNGEVVGAPEQKDDVEKASSENVAMRDM